MDSYKQQNEWKQKQFNTSSNSLNYQERQYQQDNNSFNNSYTTIKKKFNLPLKPDSSYIQNYNRRKEQSNSQVIQPTKNKSQSRYLNKTNKEDSNLASSNQTRRQILTQQQYQPSSNPITQPKSRKPSNSNRCNSASKMFTTRCHRYHSDLNFNYLSEQKFCRDTPKENKSIDSKIKKNNESVHNYNIYSADTVYSNDTFEKHSNQGFNSSNNLLKEKKNSENVLGELLDSQYSINSPSRRKIYQNEIDQMKSDEFRQKVIQNEGNNNKIYIDEDLKSKATINLSFLGDSPQEKFCEAFESIMVSLDPIFDRLTVSEKIEKFLECTQDSRRSIKLGAIVGIYLILIKYDIDESLKNMILESLINLLNQYESHEEIFLVACLEVCNLYKSHPLLVDNIGLISMFLTDFNYQRLQKTSFNCLMNMGYPGIKNLVEIASKDYQDLQFFILQSMIRTPHIQKIIIIPALLNDVFNHNPDKRHTALAAMNRMYDLVGETEAIKILSRFFQDPSVEKIFLSSTLRTSGEEGEAILLEIINETKDFKLKAAISSVLSYRVPLHPNYLEVNLEKNDAHSISKNTPGSLYRYYGHVSPVALDSDNTNEIEYLEINTRDVLAALQRMLMITNDHSTPKLIHVGNLNYLDDIDVFLARNEKMSKYSALYEKNKSNDYKGVDKSGRKVIPEKLVKALSACLKDYNPAVRETAASTIGKIGLPEGILCLDKIVQSLNDQDINVRIKSIWALGKLADGCDTNAVYHLLESLKSNIWKVRMACFITLASFGERCAGIVLPHLKKMLKDCSIQKQVIAETIVKLGIDGESCLLEIMKNEVDSNYKLKSSIAKSFALTNITSPNIDFVVECLYKNAQINNPIIRKAALFALKELYDKAEERITYLKTRHILPFFYKCLNDKDPEIQAFAISCIKNMGPQGELLFIEGLTKDSNYIIRAQCAIGLAEIGPSTIRTLIVALHDDNITVKKTIEKEIVEKFKINEILAAFQEKIQQKSSLKIAIRDILDKNLNLNPSTKKFFKDLYLALEKEIYNNEMKRTEESKKNQFDYNRNSNQQEFPLNSDYNYDQA